MKKILCLNCHVNPAIIHPRLGVLVCAVCRQKTTTGLKPQIEITTDAIKGERRAHKPDIIQPYREGQLSKEFIDHHGTGTIKATPEEIRNAQPVWNDLDYYES